MSPRVTRLLPLIIGPLSALAMAVPASAGTAQQARPAATPASSSAVAGYLSTGTTPHSTYNSAGKGGSVTHNGTGQYTVTFPGLAKAASGDFQVTPIYTSGAPSVCDISDVGTSSGDLSVLVGCFDLSGNPRDSNFNVTVTKPASAPHGALAYAADLAPANTFTPTGPFQYNSAHKSNHITHLGTGQYRVTMPGVGSTGAKGTVKVTPYASNGNQCQLQSWGATGTAESIVIDCYSAAAGTPADTGFAVVYARSNNIMGQNALIDANALDAKPTAAGTFWPAVQYDSKSGAKVRVAGTGTPGIYLVEFNGSTGHITKANGGGGDVQVTAQGSTESDCLLAGWAPTPSPSAEVVCFSHGGGVQASEFTVQWVTS